LQDPKTFTGHTWIDEELLRDFGMTDFKPYRCDPDVEPPTMKQLAEKAGGDAFKRGKALSPEDRLKKAAEYQQMRAAEAKL
jgi:hypothetical protein